MFDGGKVLANLRFTFNILHSNRRIYASLLVILMDHARVRIERAIKTYLYNYNVPAFLLASICAVQITHSLNGPRVAWVVLWLQTRALIEKYTRVHARRVFIHACFMHTRIIFVYIRCSYAQLSSYNHSVLS